MIIVDTGAFVALFDRRDEYHKEAKDFFSTVQGQLITTLPVLTETCFLLDHRARCIFLKSLEASAINIFPIETHHIPRIVELVEQYADLPMDFADASLVLLAEAFGSGQIATVDQRDFSIYRWMNNRPFENVLLPGT